jgi:Lrp/AsnC family transcriptional regulator
MEQISVDGIDRKILIALQNNPDSAIADIGALVGLSQTPCWRRLKRMQDAGLIRQRIWLMDPVALNLSVNVFAEIRLKQHDEETLESFEQMTRDRPEIIECFSMSGDSDYLLRILVGNVADYEVLLKKVLLHLPGVGSINSRFALQTVKWTTNLPI